MVVAAHLFYIFFVFFSSAFLTGISFCRCLSFSPVETTPPLHFSSPQKKKRSSINSANSSTPSIKTRKTYFFLFQKSSQSPVLHGHHVIIAKRVDRFVNRQIPAGSPLKKKTIPHRILRRAVKSVFISQKKTAGRGVTCTRSLR